MLFEHGAWPEAEAAVRELRRHPDDAAALHNLGTVCLRRGRHDEAAAALRRSLEIRPTSPETVSLLEAARRVASGDPPCSPAK